MFVCVECVCATVVCHVFKKTYYFNNNTQHLLTIYDIIHSTKETNMITNKIETIIHTKWATTTKFENCSYPTFTIWTTPQNEIRWEFDLGFGKPIPFGEFDWQNIQDILEYEQDMAGRMDFEIEDLKNLMAAHPHSGSQIWNG